MSALTSILRRISLFSDLSNVELETLQRHARLHRCNAYETLFEEGDPSPCCYVILDGKIEVYLKLPNGRQDRVAVLGSGALVGHMALIDNQARSATCKAGVQQVRLLELGREDFDRLFWDNSSFAFKIIDRLARDLVERLRSTNDRLREARRGDRKSSSFGFRAAAQALHGPGRLDLETDELSADTIEVVLPSFEERMRARRKD